MSQSSRRIKALAAAVVLVFVIGACAPAGGGAASGAAQRTLSAENSAKFVVGGVQPNAGNWPVQIGLDQGIFKKWGLDVDLIFAPTSLANLAALLGGSVNAASATYDSGIAAQLEAPELKWAVNGYDKLPYNLVVAPGITDVTQLKGKTCGAQSQTTVDGLYLRLLIDAASKGALVYDKDYKIQVLGAGGAGPKLAAFQTGQISCVAVIPPDTGTLAASGYKAIYRAEPGSSVYMLPFSAYIMDSTWYSKNREAAERFAAGMIESTLWLYEPANKTAAIALLAKNAKLTPEVASSAYEWVTIGGYPRNPAISATAISSVIKAQKQFGLFTLFSRPVDQLFDNSIVEGAIKRLPADIKKKTETP
jgi:NitT/TauT family transport system substrate-binding protein